MIQKDADIIAASSTDCDNLGLREEYENIIIAFLVPFKIKED